MKTFTAFVLMTFARIARLVADPARSPEQTVIALETS